MKSKKLKRTEALVRLKARQQRAGSLGDSKDQIAQRDRQIANLEKLCSPLQSEKRSSLDPLMGGDEIV